MISAQVREEIFGPVPSAATLRDSDSVADVVVRANDTVYGLYSTIGTKDASRAHRFARRIKARILSSLAGAVRGGREGVKAYTQAKSLAVNISGA